MALAAVPSAAASAVAGIRAASDRLDASAATLASALTPPRGEDTVTLSGAARQAATAGGEAGAVAGAMVDMRISRYQTAASVAVLRASDDMTTDLVRLGARDRR
jgi:hypothetical protein